MKKLLLLTPPIYMPRGVLEPTLETLGYPKVIAQEVASFLDMGQAMLTLCPEPLKTMNTFCSDATVLPTTVNIPLPRYAMLVACKLLSTCMFTTSMVLSTPYFVGSLLVVSS